MRFGSALALLCSVACPGLANAQTVEPPTTAPLPPQAEADPEVILVTGRRLNLVGEAISASEGVIGRQEIDGRPLLRAGDLLEFVPGLVATQHSGSGKPINISCAASTSTMAPTSRLSSTRCRSTCAPTATARAGPTSTSSSPKRSTNSLSQGHLLRRCRRLFLGRIGAVHDRRQASARARRSHAGIIWLSSRGAGRFGQGRPR